MRIREPKTTALVFASGKVVVTGAKSEDDSRLASRKYARIIQKLGFEAKFQDFKIQNIVGSVSRRARRVFRVSPSADASPPPQCDVKFPIRLEGLAYSHGVSLSHPLWCRRSVADLALGVLSTSALTSRRSVTRERRCPPLRY